MPRRCRTLSPTATAFPPGSRPRAAPRRSPGRRRASAPSISVARSMAAPATDDTGNNRPRTATGRWWTRRWAMRQKTTAMTPNSGADPSGADSRHLAIRRIRRPVLTGGQCRRSRSGGGTTAHERTRSFRRREHRCSRRGRTPRRRTRLERERGCNAFGRAGTGPGSAARQRPRQQSSELLEIPAFLRRG